MLVFYQRAGRCFLCRYLGRSCLNSIVGRTCCRLKTESRTCFRANAVTPALFGKIEVVPSRDTTQSVLRLTTFHLRNAPSVDMDIRDAEDTLAYLRSRQSLFSQAQQIDDAFFSNRELRLILLQTLTESHACLQLKVR